MQAAKLSTVQIQEYITPETTVLLPFGAFEQHGPYLPLATDSLIAEAIAERVEQALPEQVLLYPVLWCGSSNEHRGFSGTLSIDPVHQLSYLHDIFSWLAESGVLRIILFNAHGGNRSLANLACAEFSRKQACKVKSVYAYTTEVRQLHQELYGTSQSHGGSAEASLLAALRPQYVANHPIRYPNEQAVPDGVRLSFFETREVSATGVLDANSEVILDPGKGERVARLMETQLLATVQSNWYRVR